MKNLSIILSLSILCLFACKKEPTYTPPPTTHSEPAPIDSELLKHFSFLPGTYWIYKDSLNGRLDSCYVYVNYTTEYFINYRANISFYANVIDIREQNIDHTAESDSSLWEYTLKDSTLVFIHYPYNRIDVMYPFSGTTTLTLNGNTFHNVMETGYRTPGDTINSRNKFYINDSIGIIKMSLDMIDTAPPSHVWELMRWHIVK